MSLPDLAAVLWQQRDALERLTYRLECEQLVIGSGRSRWLGQATGEVETLLDELAVIDMRRAQVSDMVARELGLVAGASLEDVASAAQPPWTEVLREHRETLLVLANGLTALAEANRSMLGAGIRAVEDTISSMGQDKQPVGRGYDRNGRASRPNLGSPLVIDRRV